MPENTQDPVADRRLLLQVAAKLAWLDAITTAVRSVLSKDFPAGDGSTTDRKSRLVQQLYEKNMAAERDQLQARFPENNQVIDQYLADTESEAKGLIQDVLKGRIDVPKASLEIPKRVNDELKIKAPVKEEKKPSKISPNASKPFDWNRYLGVILLMAVALAYQPVWYANFIFDDDNFVTANPCVIGPFGLKEIWTTHFSDVCPLTLTTFFVEYSLWGGEPLPYHLINVIVHAVNGILLWRVLKSLDVPGAWLGAALWALHPMQVESVAWITELKNCQSGLFYLLTILFFVKCLKTWRQADWVTGHSYYALTLICAVLAMTSKSSTVVLVPVLALCAWWVEGRWSWHNLLRLTPIAVMAAAASVVSTIISRLELEASPDPMRTWSERLVTAADIVWFYLGKTFWPYPLMTVYPRWQFDTTQLLVYVPLLLVLITLVVLWFYRGSWARPYFFVFAYFLAALVPVMGLAEHVYLNVSFVADHFQYLAGIGPLALVGAGIHQVSHAILRRGVWVETRLGAGILIILGLMSWERTWAYEGQQTLWTDNVNKKPRCWFGYYNLALDRLQHGDGAGAASECQKDLAVNPADAQAYNILGMLSLQKGQLDQAKLLYRKAESLEPKTGLYHINLGNCLIQEGKVIEGIPELQAGLELDPYFLGVYPVLEANLQKAGRWDEAITQYRRLLTITPDDFLAHNDLGVLLIRQGRTTEGIAELKEALRINPDFTPAQDNINSVANLVPQDGLKK